MLVYKLPEDQTSQQVFIDRAEEDLLCAVSMHRRGHCLYVPSVNICYLFHQAIEKWTKAFLHVSAIPIPKKYQKTHSLRILFELAATQEIGFMFVRQQLEKVAVDFLENGFPGDLRYTETPTDIEYYAESLCHAAFEARRVVKHYFCRRFSGGLGENENVL